MLADSSNKHGKNPNLKQNGDCYVFTGTISMESEPTKRAEITGTAVIETRQFSSRNRYLPIPQTSMDKNPNLKQNPGY